MKAEPQVSVVLANWNGAQFLESALASVMAQTFTPWEFLVVDTGSTDASVAIIRHGAASDGRIRPIFIPQKWNCPAALNLALAAARGEWIARIESDDVWRPERLERQIEFLRAPGRERVGVCGSDARLINRQGRVLGTKRFPRTHGECLRALWYRNPFCHSSVLIRRRALEQCGFYDEAAALVEDLDLWFRVGWRWEFCNVPEALVSYRIWPGSLTSQKLRSLAWRAHRVRSCAARGLGYRRPSWARFYSLATLAAALFPAGLIRSLFEWGLRLREPTADPDSLGSLDLNPAGGPRDLEWAAGKKLLEHHRP